TDANAWIGEEPSVIDRGPEHEERIYPRSSVKPESNTQGEWFLSSMNSVNLVAEIYCRAHVRSPWQRCKERRGLYRRGMRDAGKDVGCDLHRLQRGSVHRS